MIDRATTWPEFGIAKNATLLYNAILSDTIWLCRYSHPLQVVHDNGGIFFSFLEHNFQKLGLSNYSKD